MKPRELYYFFLQSLLLIGSVMLMFIYKPLRVNALAVRVAEISVSNQQLLSQEITRSVAPVRKIRSFNQIEHPFTDNQKLVQLSPISPGQTEVILVTGVKVNSTNKGLEVILETSSKSDRLQEPIPLISKCGNLLLK